MPGTGRQHVQIHRKVDLRKQVLTDAVAGAAYVPFCGDGDIAAELYSDRPMYGCDVDPERIATIQQRLPDGHWFQLDADDADAVENFVGSTLGSDFAIADFDAYSYPYAAFRAFWRSAPRARKVAMFFTDGQKNSNKFRSPDDFDTFVEIPTGEGTDSAKRKAMNFYWLDTIQPWLTRAVAPWTVKRVEFYNRGQMLYWGCVVEAPADYNPANNPSDDDVQILSAADVELVSRIQDPDLREEMARRLSQLSQPEKSNGHSAKVEDVPDDALGNPTRIDGFNAAKKRRFLHQVAEGATISAAARAIGVTPRTVYHHLERFPAFKEALTWVLDEVNDSVENALYRAAISGNVTAIQVWLYNRAPDRWSDRRQRDMRMIWDDEGFAYIADIINRVADANTVRLFRAELSRIAAAQPPP